MPSQEKQYNSARQSMIDSQIHPMGVVSEALLEAFETTPREVFIPEDKRGICYCDEDIDLGGGRYLMEPSVLGRLIQAANPTKEDAVLNIGSGLGYNASILSHLASTVVALEEDEAMTKQAQKTWEDLGYFNIAGIAGTLLEGAPKHAPYDIIIINGAVSEAPMNIKKQLKIGGCLLALVKPAGQKMAKATRIDHIKSGEFSARVLFEAGTPYLKGFEPAKEFIF